MDLPQEIIGSKGSNSFSRGSVPVFLRTRIATCDFLGVRTPGPPSGSAHGIKTKQNG